MKNPLEGPIAYLTGEYPRATDTFIQREVAGLRAEGFEVETCSIRRTGKEHIVGPEQESEQARTFHVLPATAKPLASLKAHARAMKKPGRYLRALRLAWDTAPDGIRGRAYNLIYFAEAVTLAAHLRDKGVVHLHNHIAKASCTVAMLTHEVSGIPYSFTMHGPDIFFAPEHWRIDEKIGRAAFVSCISDFCRSQGMLFSDRKHWDKLHIVHCGIDPSRYDQIGERNGDRLLFVGRLAAVKGVPVLLRALVEARKHRSSLHLTLVGDGPERKELEADARALGLEGAVTFAGYRSQAEVAEVLRDTDLLVLPSFAEGVPVVLMEAMAARVPVVATLVGGVSELVREGESGRLVPPGNAEILASAILDVLAEPEARRRMGENGRRKVAEEFDARQEAKRLGVLIASSLGLGSKPPKRPGTDLPRGASPRATP